MQPSSPLRNILFQASGLLLLTGAVSYFMKFDLSPYLFAVGAAGIAVCHLTYPVRHLEIRRRRLQTFNVIAGLLMVVASVFMFRHRNEWILCLSVAAMLQLYTAFVVPGK
jgi:glucose uptake protein GlcU